MNENDPEMISFLFRFSPQIPGAFRDFVHDFVCTLQRSQRHAVSISLTILINRFIFNIDKSDLADRRRHMSDFTFQLNYINFFNKI